MHNGAVKYINLLVPKTKMITQRQKLDNYTKSQRSNERLKTPAGKVVVNILNDGEHDLCSNFTLSPLSVGVLVAWKVK